MKPVSPFLYKAVPMSLLAALPLVAAAQYQEMARVISSTPVMTQVAVPRQICSQSQVLMGAPKSGAGALLGAVAGGAVGNNIGGGSGRALATAVGVIGGAMVGDSMESAPPPVVRPVTSCTQQIAYEQRVSAWNVIYEYAGRQYSIQTPNDPGPYLPIQVSPGVAAMAPPPAVIAPPVIVSAPVISAPVYGGPAYPSSVWYGSPAISLRYGYGYRGGWDGHDRHDRHDRYYRHRDHWR